MEHPVSSEQKHPTGRKRIFRRIIAVVLSAAALFLLLKFLTDLTERKNSDYKYADFFEEENEFDVLFMGSSHMINGVFPMELWNDYGFISYNFGGHSNTLATSYWVTQMALDYTTPSLVVVDCYLLGSTIKTATGYSYVHLSMDAFPLSLTKVRAVMDLLDDEEMELRIADGSVEVDEARVPISLLWDFSVYHSRWTSISENDFEPSVGVEKGAESRIGVAVPNEILSVDKSEKIDSTISAEYLERLITECQDQGIEVLLIFLPHPANEGTQKAANTVYDIAEEYGVNYINFLDMDVVDYDTDCYDSGSHLNPSGARKVTAYLGEYISSHYDIEDHRSDSAYASWDEDYEAYADYKVSNLKEQEELDTYLMLLYDKNYDVSLTINDPAFLESAYYRGLMENLGIDTSRITEDIDTILVTAAGEEVAYIDSTAAAAEEAQETGDLLITVTEHETGIVVDEAIAEISITDPDDPEGIDTVVTHEEDGEE